MENGRRIDRIDTTVLIELVKDYPEVVPEKLATLDQQRYETIPRALADRKKSPHLTKSEVATLVDWKLSHGKFRPALRGLFQQNTEQTVIDATKDAFATMSQDRDSIKASLNALTKMRGIGPATASLLLSVYDAQSTPFFSDELFRWVSFEDGNGKGWDREIKYNMKEYLQLLDSIHTLQDRLKTESNSDVAAIDVEKAAYVLGKRGPWTTNDDNAEMQQVKKRKAPPKEVDSSSADAMPTAKIAKTRRSGSSRALGEVAGHNVVAPTRSTRLRGKEA